MPSRARPHSNKTPEEKRLQAKLSAFISEARRISENLDPIVGKYELQTSEFLVGICGGILSSLGTYLYLLKFFPTLSVVGITTACAMMVLLGIASAIFLFRGPARWITDNKRGRMRSIDEQMINDLQSIRQENEFRPQQAAGYQTKSDSDSHSQQAAGNYTRRD